MTALHTVVKKTAASPAGRVSEGLENVARYRRAVDYLAAAQIYLKSNPVVRQAAQKVAAGRPAVSSRAEETVRSYEKKIAEHRAFVCDNGVDPPEIADWYWRD